MKSFMKLDEVKELPAPLQKKSKIKFYRFLVVAQQDGFLAGEAL